MTFSNRQDRVHLVYYYEDESWWADSYDLPGLFAGDEDLAEAKKLARQVVADELGTDIEIVEWVPPPEALVSTVTRGGGTPGMGVLETWSSYEHETSDWSCVWELPELPDPQRA